MSTVGTSGQAPGSMGGPNYSAGTSAQAQGSMRGPNYSAGTSAQARQCRRYQYQFFLTKMFWIRIVLIRVLNPDQQY